MGPGTWNGQEHVHQGVDNSAAICAGTIKGFPSYSVVCGQSIALVMDTRTECRYHSLRVYVREAERVRVALSKEQKFRGRALADKADIANSRKTIKGP